MTPPVMIGVSGVSFSFPGRAAPALDGVSLEVRAGRRFGLVGPNGSGKTTLMSLLAGLASPAVGEIQVAGHEYPSGITAAQRALSLVPQENALYDRLTVRENLRFFAEMQRIGPESEPVADAVAATDLASFLDVRASNLSGGMKRRACIAIGLMSRPQVLLLDEPTVGIDPQSRRLIIDAVQRASAAGATILYASHDLAEVEGVCDDVGLLMEGRIVAQGPVANIGATVAQRRLSLRTAAPLTDAQRAVAAALRGAEVGPDWVRVDGIGENELEDILRRLRAAGAEFATVRFGSVTLEEWFFAVTSSRGEGR